MIFRWTFVTALAAALLAHAALALAAPDPAPSLQEIEKQATARWDTVNSLTASVNAQASIAACFPKVPLEGTLSGTGPLIYLRKDGKEYGRIDLAADLAQGARVGKVMALMNPARAFFESDLLGYVHSDEAQPPVPEKGAAAPGGRSLFQALTTHFALVSRGRQTLGDKPVYVIEGRPKDAAGAGPLAMLRLFLDPDLGMLVKAIGFDGQGGVLGVLVISGIHLNAPVSPNQFAGAPSPPKTGLADAAASARDGLENLTDQVRERLAR